jgi:acetate kinase
MKILVLNSGGSSAKFKVLDMPGEAVVSSGGVERIGKDDAILKFKRAGGESVQRVLPVKDHAAAIGLILQALTDPGLGGMRDISEIEAVGHRVVHGGNKLRESVVIDAEVEAVVEEYCEKAPLHNPHNLHGIRACRALMKNTPQVAVIDSALHWTLPEHAYTYALPYRYCEKYGIRKYGFHGITFQYMTREAAKLIGRPVGEMKIVSLMLGSGCTANAMLHGRSVDVSTGFTPHEGLIQSTRAGDIDATAVTYLMDKEGLSTRAVEDILNRESGWLGISGISNDMREIGAQAGANPRARLAIDAAAYRCRKYVGAYTAAMGGMDLLVFAGGAGENSPLLRQKICANMEFFGIELDEAANQGLKGQGVISAPGARVKVVVINTDEEIEIARDTYRVVTGGR